jgi:hypothetical protein
MTLHSEYQLAMKIKDEHDKDFKLKLFPKVCSFLRRFMDAADSHVELEPFIVEGQKLLEEIEEDGHEPERCNT